MGKTLCASTMDTRIQLGFLAMMYTQIANNIKNEKVSVRKLDGVADEQTRVDNRLEKIEVRVD